MTSAQLTVAHSQRSTEKIEKAFISTLCTSKCDCYKLIESWKQRSQLRHILLSSDRAIRCTHKNCVLRRPDKRFSTCTWHKAHTKSMFYLGFCKQSQYRIASHVNSAKPNSENSILFYGNWCSDPFFRLRCCCCCCIAKMVQSMSRVCVCVLCISIVEIEKHWDFVSYPNCQWSIKGESVVGGMASRHSQVNATHLILISSTVWRQWAKPKRVHSKIHMRQLWRAYCAEATNVNEREIHC